MTVVHNKVVSWVTCHISANNFVIIDISNNRCLCWREFQLVNKALNASKVLPKHNFDWDIFLNNFLIGECLRTAVDVPVYSSFSYVTEWSVSGSCYVCAVPAVLWVLCQFWRDTCLPALDYVSQLHPIRVWGHSSGHLQLWTGETQVLPGNFHIALSLSW